MAFPEILDGAAIWRLQVADPADAAEAPCSLALRVLPYPAGGILAAAAAMQDQPGRPQMSHQCVLAASLEARAWVQAIVEKGGVTLVFERRGWAGSGEHRVGISAEIAQDLAAALKAAPVPADDGQAVALAYLDHYREALPRLKTPEAVWDEIAAALSVKVPVAAKKSSALWWVLLALAGAAAAAWWFLGRG